MTAARAENIVKYFVRGKSLFGKPRKYVRAVDGVSLSIPQGKTIALVGESGCGKTTLGRLMLRLIRPDKGHIYLEQTDITTLSQKKLRPLRKKMQVIFQNPYGALDPMMKVGASVAEGLEIHHIVPRKERAKKVGELLESVGLSASVSDKYPHEFSGGQRQRICIARALAVEPRFIVADEPVSSLDISIRAQIINLLISIQQQRQVSYLLISHDIAVVRHVSHEIYVMYLGRIVERSRTAVLFKEPLHPYTQALLSAVPRITDGSSTKKILLPGDPPDPADPPSGCRFRTRCFHPAKDEECERKEPALRESSDYHYVACYKAH